MSERPPVLIVTGYGLNCEAESAHAWTLAGAAPERVHFGDLIERPSRMREFEALMFVGGFSFGDHMGSGHVFASRIRHRLRDELQRFVSDGRLILGVCNGFQIMVKLGLLPGLDGEYFTQKLALMQNDVGVFRNLWTSLRFHPASPCVFTRGLDRMDLPVRHGEGKIFTLDRDLLDRIEAAGCVACRYVDPADGRPSMTYPHNPNGSLRSIAGLCDPTGRLFGLMPHPEAFLYADTHPLAVRRRLEGRLPARGAGLEMFLNAVRHLRGQTEAAA